jgi:hypothetical protein
MLEREIGRQCAAIIGKSRFGARVSRQSERLGLVDLQWRSLGHGNASEAGSDSCRVMSAHEKGFPEIAKREASGSF